VHGEAVLIHESTHFVSGTNFRDFVHCRSPEYPGPGYMPAIRNAYGYEQFATHMFLGTDFALVGGPRGLWAGGSYRRVGDNPELPQRKGAGPPSLCGAARHTAINR
jgi:hypothetical protein